MSIELRDCQIEAVEKMRNGCILCGGVGSGKSRTSLAYYYKEQGGSLYSEGLMKNPKDLYIITTARKRDTLEWEAEMLPFLLSTNPDVNDIYHNKVVVDSWNEQRVVGSGSWVKSFLKITKANDWILLSATPGDTWTDYVPVFLANGFFKNRTEFNREHVIYSRFTKYPKVDRYIGTKKLLRLRDEILVDINFNRETVAHHENVIVDYDILKYKEVTKTRWDPYKNEPIINAAGLCYIWRKLVNTDESRQRALLEIFERHPKMIVFYNFDYELEILRGLYYGNDVQIGEWNGHRHDEVPKGRKWVYLVQYTAGAEGWNCISTDTTVFYSQNYSYKIMQQSAGRIDRLNTPFRDLYYFHLKSRSGIDLAIAKALKEKKNFNEGKFVKW